MAVICFFIYIFAILAASYIQSEFFSRSGGFIAALIVTGAMLSTYGGILIKNLMEIRGEKLDVVQEEPLDNIRQCEEKNAEDTVALEEWSQQKEIIAEREKVLQAREKRQEEIFAEREASMNKKLSEDADLLWFNITKREKTLDEQERQQIENIAMREEASKQNLIERERQQIENIAMREEALKQNMKEQEQNKQNALAAREQEMNYKEQQALSNIAKREQDIVEMSEALKQLFAEKTIGFPWLAAAYADYIMLQDEKKADWLENKPHPATTSAEIIRGIKSEKADLVRESKQLKYVIKYYESLFPWLIEFREIDDEDIYEVVSEDSNNDYDDAAQRWLTASEYKNLSPIEKYQIALDRYMTRKKTKWEIGRDYERFIGYSFEQQGYKVEYRGIIDGYEDLGRDLICFNDTETLIIQCKYWSKNKIIHEKHINQLYGTSVMYGLKRYGANEYNIHQINSILITSTIVSDTAKEFARILGVKITENAALENYPLIKCNINRQGNEKIYHLPFDQQYDKTQISVLGERYAWTVEEAERLGFRRAMRWQGNEFLEK